MNGSKWRVARRTAADLQIRPLDTRTALPSRETNQHQCRAWQATFAGSPVIPEIGLHNVGRYGNKSIGPGEGALLLLLLFLLPSPQ